MSHSLAFTMFLHGGIILLIGNLCGIPFGLAIRNKGVLILQVFFHKKFTGFAKSQLSSARCSPRCGLALSRENRDSDKLKANCSCRGGSKRFQLNVLRACHASDLPCAFGGFARPTIGARLKLN
jgi:hypothetical protein